MELSRRIHQIRIDFQVTETVERYVYVYLITGKSCYLIDTGVAGSEKIIGEYMSSLGRDLKEIKAILLTHAHPDHIGGAQAVKKISGCKVCASEAERRWIEDIRIQFQERPIPNFYSLVNEPVSVDEAVREGRDIILEEGLTMQVLETKGHSDGSVSYLLLEENALFCGDAVPEQNDFPILTDVEKSKETLIKLGNLSDISYCCPAWDRAYRSEEFRQKTAAAGELLEKLESSVRDAQRKYPDMSETDRAEVIKEAMGWRDMPVNPLFIRSIRSCAGFTGKLLFNRL